MTTFTTTWTFYLAIYDTALGFDAEAGDWHLSATVSGEVEADRYSTACVRAREAARAAYDELGVGKVAVGDLHVDYAAA